MARAGSGTVDDAGATIDIGAAVRGVKIYNTGDADESDPALEVNIPVLHGEDYMPIAPGGSELFIGALHGVGLITAVNVRSASSEDDAAYSFGVVVN